MTTSLTFSSLQSDSLYLDQSLVSHQSARAIRGAIAETSAGLDSEIHAQATLLTDSLLLGTASNAFAFAECYSGYSTSIGTASVESMGFLLFRNMSSQAAEVLFRFSASITQIEKALGVGKAFAAGHVRLTDGMGILVAEMVSVGNFNRHSEFQFSRIIEPKEEVSLRLITKSYVLAAVPIPSSGLLLLTVLLAAIALASRSKQA